MAHTPGPWFAQMVKLDNEQQIIFKEDSSGKQWEIAIVKPLYRTRLEEWHNAALIATAPDLLDALERLVLAFDVGDMGHTVLNGRGYPALKDARAAIAKARGEQP